MESVPIHPDKLEDLIAEILGKNGCAAEEARAVASHLVEASLSGHDSHGVIRIVRYHEWIAEGKLKVGQSLTTLLDSGTALHLDGGDGMGQWLAHQATELGIARAREHGTAMIALRRMGHIGRVGAYAEQACAAGLVSVFFVNFSGSRLVAPFGASQRCMSTDPIAIGVPNGEGDDAGIEMELAGPALAAFRTDQMALLRNNAVRFQAL